MTFLYLIALALSHDARKANREMKLYGASRKTRVRRISEIFTGVLR